MTPMHRAMRAARVMAIVLIGGFVVSRLILRWMIVPALIVCLLCGILAGV